MRGNWTGAILALGLVACGALAEEEVQTIAGFSVPEYDEENNMTSQLFGDLAEFLPDGDVKITNLRIESYDDDGEVGMVVTSPKCTYKRDTKKAESDDSVRITRGNMVVTGKGFEWYAKKERLKIDSNAKVVLKDVQKRMESGEEK